MIRLPATSISLSEADLSHHLQEVQVLQGLLRSGFEREQIRDFLQRRRPRPVGGPGLGILEDPAVVASDDGSVTSSEITTGSSSQGNIFGAVVAILVALLILNVI